MNDLIERQSVLNACEQSINILEAVDRIMDLPSVEQEPCEDEYIKVPKKALKYRTAGMVAYNVAWLREHWQMEMDIVCGVKPCDDCISRQAVLDAIHEAYMNTYDEQSLVRDLTQAVNELPPVNPQEPKTGHWIAIDEKPHEVWECDHCGFVIDGSGCIDPYDYRDTYKFCPNCGCRTVEPQESEDKE